MLQMIYFLVQAINGTIKVIFFYFDNLKRSENLRTTTSVRFSMK